MILIPGLMSSGDTWKSTVARYQDRFRCHVLTLAGFAGVPPIKDPLLATVRRELVDYIRAQRLIDPSSSDTASVALWRWRLLLNIRSSRVRS